MLMARLGQMEPRLSVDVLSFNVSFDMGEIQAFK